MQHRPMHLSKSIRGARLIASAQFESPGGKNVSHKPDAFDTAKFANNANNVTRTSHTFWPRRTSIEHLKNIFLTLYSDHSTFLGPRFCLRSYWCCVSQCPILRHAALAILHFAKIARDTGLQEKTKMPLKIRRRQP